MWFPNGFVFFLMEGTDKFYLDLYIYFVLMSKSLVLLGTTNLKKKTKNFNIILTFYYLKIFWDIKTNLMTFLSFQNMAIFVQNLFICSDAHWKADDRRNFEIHLFWTDNTSKRIYTFDYWTSNFFSPVITSHPL